MATEYRIRQAQYITGALTGNKKTATEWVIEQKRERVEGEDDYQYESSCWTRITSGATESEAKKWFIRWLQSEIDTAETPESAYAE